MAWCPLVPGAGKSGSDARLVLLLLQAKEGDTNIKKWGNKSISCSGCQHQLRVLEWDTGPASISTSCKWIRTSSVKVGNNTYWKAHEPFTWPPWAASHIWGRAKHTLFNCTCYLQVEGVVLQDPEWEIKCTAIIAASSNCSASPSDNVLQTCCAGYGHVQPLSGFLCMCGVCPSACGVLSCPVLTCNLCKISMVSFLVHCSVQHLEFLIHKSILWWYIWKSHGTLLPLLTTEVSDCWQSWASKASPSSVHSFSIWLDFALAGNFICILWSRCCLWLFMRISQFCCDPWGKEGAWYEACSSPQLWWRLGHGWAPPLLLFTDM